MTAQQNFKNAKEMTKPIMMSDADKLIFQLDHINDPGMREADRLGFMQRVHAFAGKDLWTARVEAERKGRGTDSLAMLLDPSANGASHRFAFFRDPTLRFSVQLLIEKAAEQKAAPEHNGPKALNYGRAGDAPAAPRRKTNYGRQAPRLAL